jgi:hypothetical protein
MALSRSRVIGFPTEALVLAATLSGTAASHAAVTISTAATSNMSCVSGVCTPTAANAVLNVSDLTTMLGSGNVQVNTGSGSLAQQVEDIFVAASFNWASANGITLDAYRSVTVQQPVAANGSAPVSLVTNDGGSGGALFFISGGSLSFLSPTNSLSINGASYTLVSSIAALAADIAADPKGRYALSASYNAGPDGTYQKSPIPNKFKGEFNGLGNTISNLSISAHSSKVALFTELSASGSISSVNLSMASIVAEDVKQRNASYVGTLVSLNYGTLFNAFASGQVDSDAGSNILYGGGLVGVNDGAVQESAGAVDVLASRKNGPAPAGLGGIAGANGGTIEGSYATGTVSTKGQALSGTIGGLVGLNGGTVTNCYAEGAATIVTTEYVGGLVGLTDTTIADSYSTGTVSGGHGSYVGGSVGYDESSGAVSDDYWDTTTSGIANLSQGAGNIANDPGITGETSAQLQAGLPTGFDPTVWAENPSINNGLPYLIANPPR